MWTIGWAAVAACVGLAAGAGWASGRAARAAAAAEVARHRDLHRLKNPLQSIILHADLLASDDDPASADETRRAILVESERAAAILSEMTARPAGDGPLR